MALEFGIWDHFERLPGEAAAAQYADRIALVQRAEELGFYGYHVAEHHLSPLSMSPSPLVYLTAVASKTSRIRLGSMVVIVPLYPAIRLAEEICMVDALSGGRLEVGVGRGIRDVEHEWWGREPSTTREDYEAAFTRVRAALLHGKVEVDVPGGGTTEVPFVHEPTQRPTPPFWYVGNLNYAAREGMSVLARRPIQEEIDAYYDTFGACRAEGSPYHQGREPLVGATRPVYVAETNEAAREVAERAWMRLADNFWATDTRVAGRASLRGGPHGPGGDIDAAMKAGEVCFGDPKTVTDSLVAFLDMAGPKFSYLVSGFQWGSISHALAVDSLELFAREVVPALRKYHDGT